MALTDIALHMNKYYSHILSKEDTIELQMEEFVEKSNDPILAHLYQRASDCMKNDDKLPFLLENYSHLLKFKIGCEQMDNPLKEIKTNGGRVCNFLITDKDEEALVLMKVLIDAFIQFQNDFLKDFGEEHQKVNEGVVQKGSLLKKLDLGEVKTEHLLCVDEGIELMVRRLTLMSTELNQENKLIPDFKLINETLARKFLTRKRYINLVNNSGNVYKFIGGGQAKLGNQIERYFSRVNLTKMANKTQKEGMVQSEVSVASEGDDGCFENRVSDRVKNFILGSGRIENLIKIEALFCRLIEDLILNHQRDPTKKCISSKKKKQSYARLTSSHEIFIQVKDVRINQLRHLNHLLRIRKGELFFEKVMTSQAKKALYLVEPETAVPYKDKKGLVGKLKRRIERFSTNNIGCQRQLLNQLFAGLNEIMDETEYKQMKMKYPLEYVITPGMAPLLYGAREDSNGNGRPKESAFVFRWMAEEDVSSIMTSEYVWIVNEVYKAMRDDTMSNQFSD